MNRLGQEDELDGLLTAMVRPFDVQNEADYQQAKTLGLSLLDSGSDGVMVLGAAGEAPDPGKEEKLQLFGEM